MVKETKYVCKVSNFNTQQETGNNLFNMVLVIELPHRK